MKLVDQNNNMKRLVIVLILPIFIFMSCETTQPFTYKVIRQNNFDSNYYKLNTIDTNKVKAFIYQSIFEKESFDTSTKCLLLNIYSVYSNEYGLYDYKMDKYYYASTDYKNKYHFVEKKSKDNEVIYNKLKAIVGNPEQLLTLIHKKNSLMDGVKFEANFISVNINKEVVVKSYHW